MSETTAPLLATRDALVAVIFEALDVSGEHRAIPIAMEERIADYLLASGVVRDPATLADDEALVDTVVARMQSKYGSTRVDRAREVLRALAAALTGDPS